jgi:hypothetical protein
MGRKHIGPGVIIKASATLLASTLEERTLFERTLSAESASGRFLDAAAAAPPAAVAGRRAEGTSIMLSLCEYRLHIGI